MIRWGFEKKKKNSSMYTFVFQNEFFPTQGNLIIIKSKTHIQKTIPRIKEIDTCLENNSQQEWRIKVIRGYDFINLLLLWKELGQHPITSINTRYYRRLRCTFLYTLLSRNSALFSCEIQYFSLSNSWLTWASKRPR